MQPLAHPGHDLSDHLFAVAGLAEKLATAFAGGDWAWLAGLWHDLGKYRPAFQQRIRAADGGEAHLETLPGKVRHAIVGALHARSLGAYAKKVVNWVTGCPAKLDARFNSGGASSEPVFVYPACLRCCANREG